MLKISDEDANDYDSCIQIESPVKNVSLCENLSTNNLVIE